MTRITDNEEAPQEESAAPEPEPEPEPQPARTKLSDRFLPRFEGQIQILGVTLNGLGKIGLVFVLVFLAATAGYWLYQRSQKSQVPGLVGTTRAEAEKLLDRRHLVLGGIQFEESDEPKGTVLRTDPRIGTELEYDSGVLLILAKPAAPVSREPVAQYVVPNSGPRIVLPPAGRTGAAPDIVLRDERPRPTATPAPSRTPDVTMPTTPVPTPTSVAPVPEVFLLGGTTQAADVPGDCATGYHTTVTQPITLSGPGELTYRWVDSEGPVGEPEKLTFSDQLTQTVTKDWVRTGQDGARLTGWQQLRVISPGSQSGDRITDDHYCGGGLG